MATALWMVAVAGALLVVLVVVVLVRVRRFAQARASLQADVTQRVGQLRALSERRRVGRD